MLIFALPLLAASLLAAPPDGARLYAQDCASCHGAKQFGSADGPSLRSVGMASVDFYLSTGRMPAAVPWIEVGHRAQATGQQLPLTDIRAIESYLAPIVAGGPPLPQVAAGGDAVHGLALYELHCQQCHGVKGVGGSLGESDWAPALDQATINEVADAVRAGPEEMPRFGERQLSQTDLDDLGTYVMQMQVTQQPAGAPPFRSTGPVPEGAVGYVAIIALVVFVFVFWRRDTPAVHREETVRRDEGERPT